MYVSSDFDMSGGQREWVIVQKLQELIARNPAPQVVNLSAGSYTRNDWLLLSFSAFDYGGITLTAAAGNDATHRKFWPAAFDWAVGVGALGADQRNRAWFSNYGDWVDVYTLGEGLVNAFATGEYTYQEPPKRPATQIFDGCARWSGTSFAAPLVAGLIAAQMTSTGASASDATQAVLAQAQAQAIPGVGPVLFPRSAVNHDRGTDDDERRDDARRHHLVRSSRGHRRRVGADSPPRLPGAGQAAAPGPHGGRSGIRGHGRGAGSRGRGGGLAGARRPGRGRYENG